MMATIIPSAIPDRRGNEGSAKIDTVAAGLDS